MRLSILLALVSSFCYCSDTTPRKDFIIAFSKGDFGKMKPVIASGFVWDDDDVKKSLMSIRRYTAQLKKVIDSGTVISLKNYREFDSVRDFDLTLPSMKRYAKHPVLNKFIAGNKAVYFQLVGSKGGTVKVTESFIAIFKAKDGKNLLLFMEE